MRELTPEEKRKIYNYTRNRRRQLQAPEARAYPKKWATLGDYIDKYNEANRGQYRQRITLDFQT